MKGITERSLSNDWIVIPRPVRSPKVHLLCFPHGGGGATTFSAWPGNLPEDVEVCALQLPGRGRRLFEAAATSIDQIIESLLVAFQPFPKTPVALFGHSFGAWVAFEFARRLQSDGIVVAHLFVSGQTAPQLPDPEPPICHLSDQEFISEVRERYEGLPEELLRDDEMMALLLPALRADFKMKETYRYVAGPLLECPISSFWGEEDGSVSADELAAWRNQTCGAFSCRMLQGSHFLADDALESMLKFLRADLECSLLGSCCEGGARIGA